MRGICLIMIAVLGLTACGPDDDDILFDGQFYRTRLKDTDARHKFVVTATPVSASLEGAREAARYEATVYCVNQYGSSKIEWVVGPDDPEEALPIADDTLTLQGGLPAMRCLPACLIVLSVLAGPVVAKPPLRDVPQIDDGLFTIGLADQIRKACPAISARLLAALSALNDLQRTARDMGYTRDEVDAHLESEAEKERLRSRARAYFDEKGLTPDEAGYCALGRMEIAEQTAIGRLLRVEN